MKHALIMLASLALAAPALAQTAPAPASAPAAPTTPSQAAPAPMAPSSEAEGGKDGVKALRASCRDEAKAKDLKGDAKREAISACVVRQRPDLAGREQCRTEGFGKGLRKKELHAFVKDCAKTKG